MTDRVAADIPAGERVALGEAARRGLDGAPAYLGRAGSCYCYRSGPLVDVSLAVPLTGDNGTSIHARLRAAVTALRGPNPCLFPGQQDSP
ncbi:hypothetical protein, partial [Nocardia sp. NPDC004711]